MPQHNSHDAPSIVWDLYKCFGVATATLMGPSNDTPKCRKKRYDFPGSLGSGDFYHEGDHIWNFFLPRSEELSGRDLWGWPRLAPRDRWLHYQLIFDNEKINWTISDRKNTCRVQFRFFLDIRHKNGNFQKNKKWNLENEMSINYLGARGVPLQIEIFEWFYRHVEVFDHL